MGKTGVKSIGIVTPFIREGDDIVKIVVDSLIDASDINDNDVIGITESVVARSSGLYVTVDEITTDILNKFGANSELIIDSPIYSRNRFAMILKGIARAARKLYFVCRHLMRLETLQVLIRLLELTYKGIIKRFVTVRIACPYLESRCMM